MVIHMNGTFLMENVVYRNDHHLREHFVLWKHMLRDVLYFVNCTNTYHARRETLFSNFVRGFKLVDINKYDSLQEKKCAVFQNSN